MNNIIQEEKAIITRTMILHERIKHLLSDQENQVGFIQNGSLFNGYAGVVYYYFSLLKAYPDLEKQAYNGLEKLIKAYNNQDNTASKSMTFCSGLSGFYFLIQKLVDQEYLHESFLTEIQPINELIFENTQKILAEENTDLLHGASGQIYYLLRCKSDPNREKYLSTLIKGLLRLAIIDEKGLRFPNSTVKVFQGTDNINMSLSHGNAGILLVLLKIYNEGFEQDLLRSVIQKGLDYFLYYYQPKVRDDLSSGFPLLVDENMRKQELLAGDFYAENHSWCYGDLAAIWLLYQSSRSFNYPAYENIADEIGKVLASQLSEAKTGITKLNSHFCHGTSGVAFFLQRLYQFTNNKAYQHAAQVWLNSTFEHLEKDLENLDLMNRPNSFGLLEGISGATFVLVAAKHDYISMEWSDLFLLN